MKFGLNTPKTEREIALKRLKYYGFNHYYERPPVATGSFVVVTNSYGFLLYAMDYKGKKYETINLRVIVTDTEIEVIASWEDGVKYRLSFYHCNAGEELLPKFFSNLIECLTNELTRQGIVLHAPRSNTKKINSAQSPTEKHKQPSSPKTPIEILQKIAVEETEGQLMCVKSKSGVVMHPQLPDETPYTKMSIQITPNPKGLQCIKSYASGSTQIKIQWTYNAENQLKSALETLAKELFREAKKKGIKMHEYEF